MTLISTHPHTRKGILGTKLGMTQVFDANNRIVPVTVIQAGPCAITLIRTLEKDGYSAFQNAHDCLCTCAVNGLHKMNSAL